MLFLYRIFYLICFIPTLFWNYCCKKKRENIFHRLFYRPKEILSGPILWVHAVSVGETAAIVPLLQKFQDLHPDWKIVISNITQTGHDTAKRLIPWAAAHFFLPFEFRHSMRRVFKRICPSLVILVEGDLWPLFLDEAKRSGARVVLVNGKISEKSFERLTWFPKIGRWLYSYVDCFCVQTELFAKRFAALGATDITVTGNIKADMCLSVLSSQARDDWRSKLGLNEGDQLIVIGSTHPSEEVALTKALLPLLSVNSRIKLLIAPRHPERFVQVYSDLSSLVSDVQLYSRYSSPDRWNIMVFDALGHLTTLYQLATLSIVAGSFVEEVGGHNILEPALFAVPVIVGPFMHGQKTLFDSAKQCNAVISVTADALAETVQRFLENEADRRALSKTTHEWAVSLQGATEKTLQKV